MNIFENIINHKINTITADELMKYAQQFQINVSRPQAKQVAEYLRGKGINIFIDTERIKLVKEIAKIAGPDVAREVNQLFIKFTKN